MKNGLQQAQTIVLLGGNSDIGRAILSELAGPTTSRIVLGARAPSTVDTRPFEVDGREVSVVEFDAADTPSHAALFERLALESGDIDVVIAAWGVLGSQTDFDNDPELAVAAAQTNYVGAVSVGLHAAGVLREQGHGHLVVLSSVAGERVRADNFVYGSTKAGVDGFAQGLADSLHGTGVHVTIVRPGFVHSSMTEGLDPAPFATTADRVAADTAAAINRNAQVVWSPGVLRWVFTVLRHLPRPVFRRLSR